MAWLVLALSGLMETAWATALSESKGFTRLWPSLIFIVTLVLSMAGLSYALQSIPVGTGYAIWVGIGAAGTATIGMLFLHEGITTAKIVCLVLVIAGVAGLKLFH
ncbi:MAG TPA: multidrug efflux SMR transporter [Streptosporangiaceae bacterium]|jgi:quaternary ammonium compound-resistance protein SugE